MRFVSVKRGRLGARLGVNEAGYTERLAAVLARFDGTQQAGSATTDNQHVEFLRQVGPQAVPESCWGRVYLRRMRSSTPTE